VAGVLGGVIVTVVGLLVAGLALVWPLAGALVQAAELGGLTIIAGFAAWLSGKWACEKLFGWFF
jgi:hypothetical protein